MMLVLLALLSQTPPANCVGNACTVGQRGNDVTLGGQVKVTVGPLGDGGTAYLKPAIQGVPLVIQSEQPTGTSSAAAVTIQATNKHDGGTILSVKNGLAEVFSVGPGGATSSIPSQFSFIDAGSVRATTFESVAAAGADGFNCLTEGCRVRVGPDNYFDETGTSLRAVTAGFIVNGNISTVTGTITSADNMITAAGADLVLGRDVYLTSGGTARRTDGDTAPTVTACSGGTAASITFANGTAALQFDVGTACAGESTAVLTMPAAANGWVCSCSSTTADRVVIQRTMPNASTTLVTLQNIVISTGANGDWTDSADVACMCRGG